MAQRNTLGTVPGMDGGLGTIKCFVSLGSPANITISAGSKNPGVAWDSSNDELYKTLNGTTWTKQVDE